MMLHVIKRWAVGTAAIAVTVWLAKLLGLKLEWESVWGMIFFVPVFGLVNTVVGPIVRLFCIPLTCLTFGLFGFVVNALMFWLAGVMTGAQMNFASALFGSVVVTLIASPLSVLIKER